MEKLYRTSEERNKALYEACNNGTQEQCANQSIELKLAYQSYGKNDKELLRPELFSKYRDVAEKYGENRHQYMESVAKEALGNMASGQIEGSVELAHLVYQAAWKNDPTAKAQLREVGQAIKDLTSSPIQTIDSVVKKELLRADELEAAGYQREADVIRTQLYLTGQLTTFSATIGLKAIVSSAGRVVIKKTEDIVPDIGQTPLTPKPQPLTLRTLDDIPANLANPDSIRNILSPLVKGKIDDKSIATAVVKVDGQEHYFLAVNGRNWRSDSPDVVPINGKMYTVIRTDSGSIPPQKYLNSKGQEVTNFNHAEQKIESYIYDNFAGKNASVQIAVQNTSRDFPGMCLGCNSSTKIFSDIFSTTIYQGSTGVNP